VRGIATPARWAGGRGRGAAAKEQMVERHLPHSTMLLIDAAKTNGDEQAARPARRGPPHHAVDLAISFPPRLFVAHGGSFIFRAPSAGANCPSKALRTSVHWGGGVYAASVR